MTNNHWLPLWVGDFVSDTAHLSDAETGQYLLLLMCMWRTGGVLPDDPVKLARVARCKEVSDDVMAFFKRENGTISQKRLTKELERTAVYSNKQRAAVNVRWAKAKALKNNDVADTSVIPPHHTINKKDNSTPKDELSKVLDTERTEAVIQHRRAIKKPLSAYAAKLLANELAKAPDPNAAADTMIAAGWQGFEVGWLENRKGKTNGYGKPQSYSAPLQFKPEPEIVKATAEEREANLAKLRPFLKAKRV